MLVLLVGNVSVGKTTTREALGERLDGYVSTSLDEARRAQRGEPWARWTYLGEVRSSPDVIAEVTGAGRSYSDTIRAHGLAHPSAGLLVVRLECDSETRRKRTAEKIAGGYVWPALPKGWSFSVGRPPSPEDVERFALRIAGRIPAGDLVVDTTATPPDQVAELIATRVRAESGQERDESPRG